MNSVIFRQYDGPWAKKPYPTSRCTVSGAGCGLVACTHIAIEQEAKKNWTPETLRPYMVKRGYAVAGQGTRWEGITETLKYLGHEKVVRIYNDPMKVAFEELNKGNRIGIILFSAGAGPNGTVWTTVGHYVAFTSYKYENGLHMFYIKDSGGRKHDGWYSYERSMKGRVFKMWIVERIGKAIPNPSAHTDDKKLSVDGIGGVGTVMRMQEFFDTMEDGVISSQNKALKKYYPAFKSVSYADKPEGSSVVKMMQKWLGISPDGILGKTTVTALQEVLGVKADGVMGKESMKAWQKYLNSHDKPPVLPSKKVEEPKKEEKKPEPKKPATPAKVSSVASDICSVAKMYCWPLGTDEKKWKYKTGAPTSTFKKACSKKDKETLSDCGYFVKKVLSKTKIGGFNPLNDKKVPSGLKVVHNGGKIKVGELQAGDIIAYKKKSGQHTLIYLGNGLIAEAGRKVRFPVIRTSTKYNKDDVKFSTLKVYRAK